MAAVIALEDAWYDGRRVVAVGKITFTGNYPAGGDLLDLSPLSVGSNGIQLGPIQGTVTVSLPNGYTYQWIDVAAGPGDPGALSGGKLKLFTAYNTELGAGGYAADLTGGNCYLEACFRFGSARS